MPPKLMQPLIDEKLFRYKQSYMLQSLMAAGYILLMFFLLDIFREGWAIAPLAASTFIAFTFPRAASSRPRYLIGGYFVAVVIGNLFSPLNFHLQSLQLAQAHVLCCTAAMLVTMLLMVCFDVEHPPAAALSITLVLTEEPLSVGVAAVLCVCVLSLLKRLLARWLRNL